MGDEYSVLYQLKTSHEDCCTALNNKCKGLLSKKSPVSGKVVNSETILRHR